MPKTKISDALSQAFSMLKDRGINSLVVYTHPPIKEYSSRDKYIITSCGQIINDDDIPDECEVVYAIINEDYTWTLFEEDPVNTSKFFAMIFEKNNQ